MRYASIRSMDISNGEGVGISLFVQGCPFHCPNCFNSETWDFYSGREWTKEVKTDFIKLASRPYIKRISLLGGEPLAEQNLNGILDLVLELKKQKNDIQDIVCDTDTEHNILGNKSNEIRLSSQQKQIWLYSGYQWEHIFDQKWHYHPLTQEKLSIGRQRRQQILSMCDVLVDGLYQDNQRDIQLVFKGSYNQRIIDVQKSIRNGEVILW